MTEVIYLDAEHQELPSSAPGADIVVIVPGTDVLITDTSLPKLSHQRLRQALPFALEEKLIADISELHFAIGEYQPHHLLPVAIVTKQKMETWLQQLNAAGITPKAIIPATLAIPFSEKNWHVVILDKIALVRTAECSGFACDSSNLNTLLHLQWTETTDQPSCLTVYNFSADIVPVHVENLKINEVDVIGKDFQACATEWVSQYSAINLLQGSYQSKQKTTLAKKIWHMAAYFTAAWIIVLFLSNITSYFILKQSVNSTEQAINQIYKRNFPAATAIVSPRQRMEDKLKKITSLSTNNNFLSLLGIIANSISKIPDLRIHALEYQHNVLNLTVSGPTFDHVDKFTQLLVEQQLTVKPQNADSVGTEVRANLLIQKGGA